MAGNHRERVVGHLIAALQRAWYQAGNPSYDEVEEMSDRITQPVGDIKVVHLARSTLHGVLGGQRQRWLKWPWVASLVIVLRAVAAHQGMNPDAIGTIADWKARYQAALRLLGESPADDIDDTDEPDQSAIERLAISLAADKTPRTWPTLIAAEPTATGGVHEDLGRERLLALATRVHAQVWWQEFADVVADWFVPYLTLEQAARRIRVYETRYIPGLLQTEEYAEAVIRLAHNTAPTAEIRRRVVLRMRRQKVLKRTTPAQLWCVVDEAALHLQYGNRAILRRQIQYLIDISHKPNVTIQVIPFARGIFDACDGPIALLRFIEDQIRDLIYREHSAGARYPSEPAAVVYYGQTLDRLSIQAENPDATRDLLRQIIKQI